MQNIDGCVGRHQAVPPGLPSWYREGRNVTHTIFLQPGAWMGLLVSPFPRDRLRVTMCFESTVGESAVLTATREIKVMLEMCLLIDELA